MIFANPQLKTKKVNPELIESLKKEFGMNRVYTLDTIAYSYGAVQVGLIEDEDDSKEYLKEIIIRYDHHGKRTVEYTGVSNPNYKNPRYNPLDWSNL